MFFFVVFSVQEKSEVCGKFADFAHFLVVLACIDFRVIIQQKPFDNRDFAECALFASNYTNDIRSQNLSTHVSFSVRHIAPFGSF